MRKHTNMIDGVLVGSGGHKNEENMVWRTYVTLEMQ